MNACYSTAQGQFTSLGIPFTVAMEGPVADNAAIIFARGFYDSIGAGKDVEFSFRQGLHALRLSGHPDSVIPKLLRKGEVFIAEEPEKLNSQPNLRGANQSEVQPLLVGIGIDVSGSMEANLNNKVGARQTRLEGFRGALEQGLERGRAFLEAVQNTQAQVHLFAYAFGLRTGDVCDLFSLVKASDGIISGAEVEELKDRYTREIKNRYSGLGGLESLARSYGFGGILESAKSSAHASAAAEVRHRILAEVQRRLSNKLLTVGELTLRLDEIAKLWQDSSTSLTDAEGLIFGNTPMCQALRKISNRFNMELKKRTGENVIPILLLISDGEPTDDNPKSLPESLAEEIKRLGVTIICCYITNDDLSSPRTLHESAIDTWPYEAQLMFRMSSVIPEDSPLKYHLLRQGWTIAANAKGFVQANHSEILEELVGLALSPIETRYELLPKGI